jgi:acyl-CoA reductase-like NAD-dependent aldehyde dehydrogenase
MSSSPSLRKPLGIRATPEEHERITRAAQREHRSVNSFVLRAALQAAEALPPAKPRRSPEEIRAILKAAREEVQAHNPDHRDLLAELTAERREAATRGE